LDTSLREKDFASFQVTASADTGRPLPANGTEAAMDTFGTSGHDDALVDLFRQKFQAPVEVFLKQMREQRQAVETHTS
jgi:hypothetical protein